MGKNFAKYTFAFALGVCIVAVGIFIWQTRGSKVGDKANEVRAGSSENISGFAWSENIGWVSFNSTDCDVNGNGTFEGVAEGAPAGCPVSGSAVNYGVDYNSVTQLFTGYAWSESIGWIKFDPAGPYPEPCTPCNSAKLDLPSGKASGWARAVAGTAPDTGGWDGWIKLAKEPGDGGQNYGVTYNKSTQEFEGWAWGGEVVGWISFNSGDPGAGGASYAVRGTFNTPPTVSNLQVSPGNFCASPSESFSWTFSDAEDGATQTSYQLQADTNSGFGSPVFDTGVVTSASTSRSVTVSLPPTSNLEFNETYFWRVQVFDAEGASSGWSSGAQFTTPSHPYPAVNFTWKPSISNISQKENVFFTDTTNFYSPTKSWLWEISNATYRNGTTTVSQNPVVTFNTTGAQTAKLTATNDLGSCSVTKSLGSIKTPLPEFKEVKPQ